VTRDRGVQHSAFQRSLTPPLIESSPPSLSVPRDAGARSASSVGVASIIRSPNQPTSKSCGYIIVGVLQVINNAFCFVCVGTPPPLLKLPPLPHSAVRLATRSLVCGVDSDNSTAIRPRQVQHFSTSRSLLPVMGAPVSVSRVYYKASQAKPGRGCCYLVPVLEAASPTSAAASSSSTSATAPAAPTHALVVDVGVTGALLSAAPRAASSGRPRSGDERNLHLHSCPTL